MDLVEVYDCERRARTIAAIKYVRQLRELGLAEAKSVIDEVYYGRRSVILDFASETEAEAFAEHMTSLGFSCRFVIADQQRHAE